MQYSTLDIVITSIFTVLTIIGVFNQVIAPSLKWDDCVAKAKHNFALQTYGSRIGWDLQLIVAVVLFGLVWWIDAPLFMMYCVISYVVYGVVIGIGFMVKADKDLIAENGLSAGFIKNILTIIKIAAKNNV